MKIIFLDRDGVINKDPGGWTKYDYVADWSDFHILPGVFDALKVLKENGYRVIIISNQAGVGKGYFTESDLKTIDGRMVSLVKANGGEIEASYYCTHKDEDNCHCRKPGIGLFEKAKEKYKFDSGNTYFLGDTRRDIEAGSKARLKTALVLTGKAGQGEIGGWLVKPDRIFKDLLEAVEWIVKS